MLNIMGLLDKPTSGWVIIDDVRADSLYDRDMARIRNQKLGFIFQSFHLIPSLNVLDNVLLPMLYRRGSSASANRKRALELIEKVGLTHRLKHFLAVVRGTVPAGGDSESVDRAAQSDSGGRADGEFG